MTRTRQKSKSYEICPTVRSNNSLTDHASSSVRVAQVLDMTDQCPEADSITEPEHARSLPTRRRSTGGAMASNPSNPTTNHSRHSLDPYITTSLDKNHVTFAPDTYLLGSTSEHSCQDDVESTASSYSTLSNPSTNANSWFMDFDGSPKFSKERRQSDTTTDSEASYDSSDEGMFVNSKPRRLGQV